MLLNYFIKNYSHVVGYIFVISIHSQWEFQDPKMEVLYHIRPYFAGIFSYMVSNINLFWYTYFWAPKWTSGPSNIVCTTEQTSPLLCSMSKTSIVWKEDVIVYRGHPTFKHFFLKIPVEGCIMLTIVGSFISLQNSLLKCCLDHAQKETEGNENRLATITVGL